MITRTRTLFIAVALILSTLLSAAIPNTSLAHRDGCHRWHSCPSDSGSYVCGDLGYYSECGSAERTIIPTPTVHTPIKSTVNEVKESTIKYKIIRKANSNEYGEYKKVLVKGADGISASTTVIQLSDGAEVSRGNPVTTIKQPPVDEVVEVGAREKPVAKITKIREMTGGFMNSNKGKYIVEGLYVSNKKVTLYQNNKKVGTTKTNKDGYFEIKGLKKGTKPSWLTVYDQRGNRGKRLSEPTQATFTTKSLKTEYSISHN